MFVTHLKEEQKPLDTEAGGQFRGLSHCESLSALSALSTPPLTRVDGLFLFFL